jgi:hypothetical protein
MGMIGSIAGTPLSQTKGSEVEKAVQDTESQARTTQAQQRAESAAGIGQTEEDSEANDRDADGRRLWEVQQQSPPKDRASAADAAVDDPPRSKDPTGMSGNTLDLSG